MEEIYSRTHPFMAKLIERKVLGVSSSLKETYHLVIDLEESGIRYAVGDCIAVLPSNNLNEITRLLSLLEVDESEIIKDRRSDEVFNVREYFSKRLNINDCSSKFVNFLLEKQPDTSKQKCLKSVIDHKKLLKQKTVVALLEENQEVKISPQDIASFLRPMMPRFYSIASSMNAVGEEVHLTIALGKCRVSGEKRAGVCTDFLCNQVSLNTSSVPIYLHPNKGFTTPSDSSKSIIMVGPGTGIAPFRGFLQERERLNAPGKNWIFFGECYRKQHYFYESYWTSLQEKGILSVDLAFSRDQEEKVYVQHCLLEKGKELFQWLEEGAYFYVCGDASKMAKDVDAALHQIIQMYGGFSEEESKLYVKKLKSEKRYARDVY